MPFIRADVFARVLLRRDEGHFLLESGACDRLSAVDIDGGLAITASTASMAWRNVGPS